MSRPRIPFHVITQVRDHFVGRVLPLILTLLVLVGVFWAFRAPLLRGMGTFLITEDPLQRTDAIYVLGGAPLERGIAAAHLLIQQMAPVAYCTGENIPHAMRAMGSEVSEADLSRMAALDAGADQNAVLALPVGTSTWEEAMAIHEHAHGHGYSAITIVSTELHLRRVGRVFRKRFKGSGITVVLRAAPSLQYDTRRWWTSEEGLLMVNNEYVKLLYYLLRY